MVFYSLIGFLPLKKTKVILKGSLNLVGLWERFPFLTSVKREEFIILLTSWYILFVKSFLLISCFLSFIPILHARSLSPVDDFPRDDRSNC